MAGKETTTKFKVDISELKANIKEANRQIALANSQFKEASAGMDDWRKSTDGLSAKLKQLDSVTSQYKAILAELEKQYAEVVAEQGEGSAGAIELEVKMNNLKATIKNNEAAMSKYEQSLDDAKKATDDIGDSSDDAGESVDELGDKAKDAEKGFTVMKGAIADLVADGLQALAEAVKETMQEMVFEFENAFDSFQAKTGTATDAMGDFEEQIREIYDSGLGESIGDIADVMAEIKQQTKEVDPSKLKELSENAIILRDTFDFDVPESMRAVNMLMKDFGLTGEEAFNLIVQGAQNGLNKNGDLLDVINEYSKHYKQLGYTSDDFFNSLANGAETGTFSVDKLGDAMKEFGIRTKDTAQSTTEAFEMLGLNADEMRKAFAKGGDEAKKATEKTIKALFEMDDQVKQNQAGVGLFGTMWEDLGADTIKALMNTQGELTKTKKSMEEITQLRMDNVSTKFEAIGRSVKTDLLLPLAEKLLPTIEKVADYAIKNSDKVVNTLKVIGTVIATVFMVNKIATFTQSISTMVTTFKNLKTAITGATAAQTALNTAQTSSGWGAIATAIGLVVAALITYAQKTKDSTTEVDEFNKKIDEQTEAYNRAKEARAENVEGIDREFGYYSQLVDELSDITDENGRVIEGYKDRANFITSTLSEALGTEINLDDLVVKGKQSIIDKIDELILKKKAEVQLNAHEEAYADAVKQSENALNDYMNAQRNHTNTTNDLAEAQAELSRLLELQRNSQDLGNAGWNKYDSAVTEASAAVRRLKEEEKENASALNDTKNKYLEYQNTIKNYESVSAAIISGDSQKINDSLTLLTHNFQSAENATKESLEQQVKNAEESLANLQLALKMGTPGVTQEMVNSAQEFVRLSKDELKKLETAGTEIGTNTGKNTADGMTSQTGAVTQAGSTIAQSALDTMNGFQPQFLVGGEQLIGSHAQGMIDNTKSETDAAGQVGQAGVDTMNDFQPEYIVGGEQFIENHAQGMVDRISTEKAAADQVGQAGVNALSGYQPEFMATGGQLTESAASGTKAQQGSMEKAAQTVANKGVAGFESVDSTPSGTFFGQGFINGMSAGTIMNSIWNAAWDLGKKALSALKEAIKEGSPAKETIKRGEFFGEGFAVGIYSKVGEVAQAAATLGHAALTEIQQSIAGIDKILPEDENKKKNFEAEVKKIQYRYDFGLDDESTYYNNLQWLRDNMLTPYSDAWIDTTKKIYDYQKKIVTDEEEAKKKALADLAEETEKRLKEQKENEKKNAEEREANRIKARDNELKELERAFKLELITEEEYYKQLEKFRDRWYSWQDDEWYNFTYQINDYQKKVLEEKKSLYEETYASIYEYVSSKLQAIEEKQKSFAKTLNDSISKVNTVTVHGWEGSDEPLTWYALPDFTKDIENAEKYSNLLLTMSEKLRASGADESAVNSMLEHIESLGNGEEGLAFLEALNRASDSEFSKYISDYSKLMALNSETTKNFYKPEMAAAVEEAKKGALDIANDAGVEISEEFENSGTTSAQSFGNAFCLEFESQLEKMGVAIKNKLSSLFAGIGAKIQPSVGLSFGSGLPTTTNNDSKTTVTNNQTNVNHNYTQNIYSPEPLKRVDIYRNTNNLLGLARG